MEFTNYHVFTQYFLNIKNFQQHIPLFESFSNISYLNLLLFFSFLIYGLKLWSVTLKALLRANDPFSRKSENRLSIFQVHERKHISCWLEIRARRIQFCQRRTPQNYSIANRVIFIYTTNLLSSLRYYDISWQPLFMIKTVNEIQAHALNESSPRKREPGKS